MDPTAITAATSGHDSSPFAFSANGTGADRVQPGFFCRTVLSTITSPNAGTTGAATADTVLTGGQKAKCYGALKGAQWTGTVSFNWGSRDAGNTLKRLSI